MLVRSVKHKGLKRLLENDDPRGVSADQVNRVRKILIAVITAKSLDAEYGGLSLMTDAEPITKIGMKPLHPGAFIREEIFEPLQLSVPKAAKALGVRVATVYDLVNGKSSLSPEMALRIEKAFGVNMDMLLNMQTWFDTHAMRERADEIAVRRFVPDAPVDG